MSYKVVPFDSTKNPVADLQSIVDQASAEGYKYVGHEYSDKLYPGSAGCFGLGAQPDSTVHIGFVIFEKKE